MGDGIGEKEQRRASSAASSLEDCLESSGSYSSAEKIIASAESIDASVADEMKEDRGESSRFLLRNGREAGHLALGIGACLVGYEVIPPAAGLIYEAGVRVVETAQPFIEVVSQHPLSIAAGAILAPTVLQRYLRSRDSTLSKAGIGVTAAVGSAAGLGLGRYSPEVMTALHSFATDHSLQVAGGVVGAAVPLVSYLMAPKEEKGSKLKLAAQSILGAAIGVSASYTIPLIYQGMKAMAPVILSATQPLARSAWAHLPEIIAGGLGSLLLPAVMNKFTRDDEGNFRKLRYNALRLVGAAGGVGLAAYGSKMMEAATLLFSKVEPSLEVLVNSLPELGAFAAGAGAMLYASQMSIQSKKQRLSWLSVVARIPIGGLAGLGFYEWPATSAIFAGMSILGGGAGILATNPQLRQKLYSPIRYVGRAAASGIAVAGQKVVQGAAVVGQGVAQGTASSFRYAAGKLSTAWDAVTPSEKSISQHPGRYFTGVVAGGTGLAATAAFMEPMAGAVLPYLSLADIGVVGAAVAGIVGLSEGIRAYISRRR